MSTTTDFRGDPTEPGSASCRRRRARRELPFALLYADFGADGGVVLNLSEDGFCVRTAMPLVAESLFTVRLRGGRDGGRMDARGKVMWMSASGKTAGVRFVELSQPGRRQIGKWLALLPPPNRTDPAVSNAPSRMTERAPWAGEQDSQDQSRDEILAGFSPSLGAIAGATILLLSVLIFGLIRLSGGGNLSAETDDAARILNAMPAETMSNQATAASAPDKSHALAYGASGDDFPSRAGATPSRPSESATPHILASSSRRVSLSDKSLQSTVRPEHELATAATPQSMSATPSRSPENVSPTQTEAVQVPVPSPRPERSLLSDAPPIGDSLAATDAATSSGTNALPDIHPGAAASPVTRGAENGLAALTTAPPGHLDSAHLIQSVQPVYPPEARKKHLEGTVELRLVVDTDGRVQSVNVVTGSPLLAPAAMDAARQFRYSPALLDGRPIETIRTADISFQLKR